MTDYQALARERWKECEAISEKARAAGLDATPAKVNMRLSVWRQWAGGRLATGHLIKMVGVRFIPRER